MLKPLTLILFFASSSFLSGQIVVEEPQLMPIEMKVYVDVEGDNSYQGDSLQPVADFSKAMQIIKDSTANRIGEVYAEVVFYEGTYSFTLGQGIGNYEVGNRFLNISIRGKGDVVFDERLSPGSSATAMVHLLGSNISVRNIRIAYCEGSGTLFGLVWNGNEIVPHDILVQNVILEGSGNHGLFAGLGRFANSQQSRTLPWMERIMFENCTVTNSVNHNDMSASSWGSAFKFHYVKHGIIRNCLSFNNAGEGIDLDDCNTVLIENSESHDNRASVYFDKAENVIFRNNLVYSTFRSSIGLLLSTEVTSALVTNHYLRNLYIYNNVFLNVPAGIGYWMGSVSAVQKSILQNVQICNNTFVGKRINGMGILNFAYEKNPFNPNAPANNVQISNVLWQSNIVAFSDDSLGKVFTAPLKPQPGLTTNHNLYHYQAETNFNSATDSVNALLPRSAHLDSLQAMIPAVHREFTFLVDGPLPSYILTDYFRRERRSDSSNVGAIERELTPYVFTTSYLSGCDSASLANGNVVYASLSYSDTFAGFLHDTIHTEVIDVFHSTKTADTLIACDFVVRQGETIFSDTLIVDSLNTMQGCDSLLMHYIGIESASVHILQLNDTLFVTYKGDSVQWVNCATGEVWKDSVGYVTTAGSYRAISWYNDCVDSTNCETINSTVFVNEHFANECPEIKNGKFTIHQFTTDGEWEVFDLQGKKMVQWEGNNTKEQVPKSLYVLRNKLLPECGAIKVFLE